MEIAYIPSGKQVYAEGADVLAARSSRLLLRLPRPSSAHSLCLQLTLSFGKQIVGHV